MPAQESSRSSERKRDCRQTQTLDLRDRKGYVKSVEWVRRNVVLGKSVAQVLQLNVLVLDGTVTLFMQPADHYIMGFRGAEEIYLLRDGTNDDFGNALKSELGEEAVVLDKVSSGHGSGGLKTFEGEQKPGKKKAVPWEFRLQDLCCAQKLSGYAGGSDCESLRKPLSLLVCMIAESARVPMMEFGFTNLFYMGFTVSPDRIVQSYKDAKEILMIAGVLFPNDLRDAQVERLIHRCAQFEMLLNRIKSPESKANSSTLVEDILGGRVRDPLVSGPVNEFRDACEQLKIEDRCRAAGLPVGEFVTAMIGVCHSEAAVLAARYGINIPDILPGNIRVVLREWMELRMKKPYA